MKRSALLIFLLLALVGADAPAIHSHDATSPGIYNEECPLARLAVPAWARLAAAPEPIIQLAPVPSPALMPSVAELGSPVPPSFGPRAPPSIS